MGERTKPYAPRPDEHPLVTSASSTFRSAREGLEEALAYYGATDGDDTRRMRTALAGIAAACDSLKTTANSFGQVIGRVHHADRSTQTGGDPR